MQRSIIVILFELNGNDLKDVFLENYLCVCESYTKHPGVADVLGGSTCCILDSRNI